MIIAKSLNNFEKRMQRHENQEYTLTKNHYRNKK